MSAAAGTTAWEWTSERCLACARAWERVNEAEYARDFDWHYDPAFPIASIAGPEDWTAWFAGEVEAKDEEGRPGYYDEIVAEPIREPIVIHLDEARMGRIWDGYHRTGGSASMGRTTVPSIVGIRKRL